MEPDSTGDSTIFDVVDEYLNFFDANDDNLTFDPSELIGTDSTATDQAPLSENIKVKSHFNIALPCTCWLVIELHTIK